MKTLFFVFIFIILSSFLSATVINIPADQPTIQDGITAAANGDTVLVQPGTYVENINYNGKLITLGSLFLTTQDTTHISSTIIDGNSSGSVVKFENHEDATTVLCGFTIINGLGSGSYPDYSGGGIFLRCGCHPILNNLTITGNTATSYGGGIYYQSSTSSLENVTITGNTASFGGGIYCYGSYSNLENVLISSNTADGGGGIYCYDSNPSFNSVTIKDNTADDGGGICCGGSSPSLENVTISGNSASSKGGGIYCGGSSPSLENVTITGNTAGSWGGGIYCDNSNPSLQDVTITYNSADDGGGIFCYYSSSPDLYNVTITDNTANTGGGICCDRYSHPILEDVTITDNNANTGGGIYCYYNSNPTLENVTVTDNTANTNGGGIYCSNSTPILNNVTISGNSADYGFGGGIYCVVSNPSLHDVAISGNSANHGGGIYCYLTSNPSLERVTISGNSAGYWGGGIYCDQSNPSFNKVTISGNTAVNAGGGIYCENTSNPSLINSILWNNSPQEIYINSGSVTATYSDIQGGWGGTGNINSDPLFVDQANGDYHLQSSSPCIDAGDPASPLDPDGTIVDMGAYHFGHYNGPTWHISTTGSDLTGTGWEQNPFATIQHGIDASADTDTVLVQPGTYVENINFNGKLITLGSLFLTTQNTIYISSTIIDGNSTSRVVSFLNGEDSSAIIKGFTITNGNTSYGGGVYCNSSNPTLENLIITGNNAGIGGGGISCYLCSPSIKYVTILENSAVHGAGIYCSTNSHPSLENVTISGNSASSLGGGIYGINSNPNLINSILWNDSPPEIYIISGSVTATYSDIQGGWTGNGNIDADPLFVDFGSGDYHLQSTSPCIDAGDPASPLDPDGTRADMGAYYFHNNPVSDFIADTINGYHPLTVNFTDLSTQGSGVIDEWYWDFGDGNNSTLQNPANEYQLPGIYTVSLAVTDINNFTDTETKVDYIIVDPPAYNGPVWHISTTGSDASGNGSTQFPFATIQNGISVSADTDTVLVQPGTYLENINFSGKLITVGSLFLTTQDTSYISSTTIDGNSSGKVVSFVNSENSSAVLCGFTITNGLATGSSPANSGGGIYCVGSSPSLENVTVSGNSATHGGGIYCTSNSHPSLGSVLITDNSAIYSGGGISCSSGSYPSLQNATISGNFAGSNGGAISSAYSANPSLINSILWNNSSPEIYLEMSGSVTATYSDIGGGWAGTGNINADPLFVDASNGDYSLQPTSPCIDAGDPASPLDPDSTIADMGAYYFNQTPIVAEFTSNITQGYYPLTINFIDLSTQGTGVIDEWYWDFGDGNNSSLQHPANEYQLPGIYTVSLTVTDANTSIDTETKIDYITVFGTDQPAPPTNVQVNIVHPDAIITWAAVDTTIFGDPIIPDGYIVLNNEDPYADFIYLSFTQETTYTHIYVGQYIDQMFYRVVAVINLSREEIKYLLSLNNSRDKVKWLDVRRNFNVNFLQ